MYIIWEVTKMPHINRLRLVNVNFNDAKGIYDNFMMRLDGKSTTYDLMNAGGKIITFINAFTNSNTKYIFKKRKTSKKYIFRRKSKKNITLFS